MMRFRKQLSSISAKTWIETKSAFSGGLGYAK